MKLLFLIPLLFAAAGKTTAQTAAPEIILKENGVENAYPRLSADDERILYQSNRTGKWQLFICDTDGSQGRQLTTGDANNNYPDWTTDNSRIAFVSDRDGNEEIYMMKADGAELKRITSNGARDIHPYFSPDGKYILFNSDRNNNEFDVYRYTIATGKTERLTETADNETCARYSPDMKSIVMLRNSESADDVYVLNTANFLTRNISNTPGVYHGWPMYSFDGKWIYYSSMENGTYSIFRIRPDGKEKQQLTDAKPGEEHARVNISRSGKFMVYNIKNERTISIVRVGVAVHH